MSENRSRFIVEPLEPGFGYTLGNTLRRTLLSRIPGAAITSVRIEGVQHEFSTIPGIVEDVVDIILNLKRVVMRVEADEPQIMYLSAKGERSHRRRPEGARRCRGDQHRPPHRLPVGRRPPRDGDDGRTGRRLPHCSEDSEATIGIMPIDSIFSPVRKVTYRVESTQVGQMTNFDRLVIDIETDGSIDPQEAISSAGKTLRELMGLFADIGEGIGLELGDISTPSPARRTSTSPSKPSTCPSAPATACAGLRSRRSANW